MDLPSGCILIWSGALIDIPPGYILCDGNNGTPDLRDRFVVAAGGAYAVGATGGATTHTHTFTSIGHSHTLISGVNLSLGVNVSVDTNIQTDSGTTDPESSLPPYYALAYIMRS